VRYVEKGGLLDLGDNEKTDGLVNGPGEMARIITLS
jgi:hypothetical protein